MVDRIATRVEEARKTSLTAAHDMYYAYFRVPLYRTLFKEGVDEILTLDECTDCIMTVTEIRAYK